MQGPGTRMEAWEAENREQKGELLGGIIKVISCGQMSYFLLCCRNRITETWCFIKNRDCFLQF